MVLKYFFTKIIKPLIVVYLKNNTSYYYKGFKLIVLAGVFHPRFFFSTKYLFKFIDKLNLENKNCIEIGCGCGLLSLLMCNKKGTVTAIDINDLAIKNTHLNFENNSAFLKANYSIFKSNLFENVTPQFFDFIVINPPYFFKDAHSINDAAWNCGANGEYFINLFYQLKNFSNSFTKIYIILADNCDIERIKKIALKESFNFTLVESKKIYWEKNYIFKVESIIYT